MNKFIHVVGEFKYQVAMFFMVTIMGSMCLGYLHGATAMKFNSIWQMMLTAGIFAGLQYIYTAERFDKISVQLKLTIHLLLSYGVIITMALLFHWFDILNSEVFWQFTLIFIIAYVLLFIGFSIYYRSEGAILNKKLAEYKEKNK